MSDSSSQPSQHRSVSQPGSVLRAQILAVLGRCAGPVLVAVLFLGGWEYWVKSREIPKYVLPAPSHVLGVLDDADARARLAEAWKVTARTAVTALVLAGLGGGALALLLTSSRIAEISLFPYAVLLQVTPMVAMAPLIVIWVGIERTERIWLVCAWIVAFFPILANTAMGLRSVDPRHRDLFDLYGSNPWQRFWRLLVPSALPYFLAGLKVAANLAMVGAVVAEFVTGAATEPQGLATVLFEAQYRQDMPLMFAALGLISLTGIFLFYAAHLAGYLLLRRWHASHVERA